MTACLFSADPAGSWSPSFWTGVASTDAVPVNARSRADSLWIPIERIMSESPKLCRVGKRMWWWLDL